jgi:uncharacterized protein YndB with AHSA1/START domain
MQVGEDPAAVAGLRGRRRRRALTRPALHSGDATRPAGRHRGGRVRYEPEPGSPGEIVFGDRDAGGTVVPFTVVDARPPRTFSFRWTHPVGEVAAEGNSLLVTFDLTPSGGGTLLKMTETGFREMGWEAAVLEQQYRDHLSGWDFYLPRLAPYAATLEMRP